MLEKKAEPRGPGPMVGAILAAKRRLRVEQMAGSRVADRPLTEFRERIVGEMGGDVFMALQTELDTYFCDIFFKIESSRPYMSVLVSMLGRNSPLGHVLVRAKKEAGWLVDAHGARTVVRFADDTVPVGDRVLLAVAEVLEQFGVVVEEIDRGDKG